MNISSDGHKTAVQRGRPGPHRDRREAVDDGAGRAVVTDLCTPGRIDVGLLRRQRDWLLRLSGANSPVEVAHLVKTDSGHLDGLVNLLDAMLDSAEGYPTSGSGLGQRAAGSPAGYATRAR